MRTNATRDKSLLPIVVAPRYRVPETNCLAIYSNKSMARESGPFAIQADIKQVTCAVMARINHRMHKVDAQLLLLANHRHEMTTCQYMVMAPGNITMAREIAPFAKQADIRQETLCNDCTLQSQNAQSRHTTARLFNH